MNYLLFTLLIWIPFAHDLPRPTDGTSHVLSDDIIAYFGKFVNAWSKYPRLAEFLDGFS